MSVPPDYMQLSPLQVGPSDLGLGPQMSPLSMSWQQNLQGMLGNPQTMGLAAALLQASGPSRMPTSLGSALGSGIMYGPQYEQQGLQNQMQKLMLGQTIAKMNYMLNPPGQNQSPQQQTSQTAQAGNPGIGITSSPQDINNALMTGSTQSSQASPASVDTTSMSPQQMVTAPATYSDPMKDPYYNYLAGGARIGLPGWDTLAGQRQQFLLAQPGFQAAQAGAKAAAEFPYQAQENYLRYAGAPKELQPGIPAVAGGAFLPGALQKILGFDPNNPITYQNSGGTAKQTGGQASTAIPQTGNINGFPVLQGPSMANYSFAKGQGEAATKYFEDLSSKADAAQTQNNIIDQMRGDFQTFTPSKTAAFRGKTAEWLNAFGFPVDKNNVGAYESSNKLGVQLQSAMTKTLGSREAAQVFTIMGNAVPNNTLAPNGFERVADFMQGAGDYVMAKKQYAQQFANSGDANKMNSVDATFQKYSNPSYFIIARANPEQQQQFIKEMGSKQKAIQFLTQWQNANKMGLAPPVP